jgi:hypothetical protein
MSDSLSSQSWHVRTRTVAERDSEPVVESMGSWLVRRRVSKVPLPFQATKKRQNRHKVNDGRSLSQI